WQGPVLQPALVRIGMTSLTKLTRFSPALPIGIGTWPINATANKRRTTRQRRGGFGTIEGEDIGRELRSVAVSGHGNGGGALGRSGEAGSVRVDRKRHARVSTNYRIFFRAEQAVAI